MAGLRSKIRGGTTSAASCAFEAGRTSKCKRALDSPQSSGCIDRRAARLASYLGWTLDAFDHILDVICLTTIGRASGNPPHARNPPAVARWPAPR
jgi:hypothetical protein